VEREAGPGGRELQACHVSHEACVNNTALTYTLWAQSQRSLRAVESSVLGDLTVVQVALLGWVVLGEGLHFAQIAGIVLALAGVVVVQIAPMLQARSHGLAS
jgi:drug/metabolite transporter (DMT)-like permease